MPVLETAPELKLSVAEISNLTEQLQEYCAIYNPLFRRAEQREYAGDYVHGLLLDLPRKSVEPMVLTLYGAEGNAVRGMQQFLGEGKWEDWVIRQRHWQEVNTTLGEDDGVFIIDGSDFPKQGTYSVGVKRQYCGQLGKRANCQAGVFLGYASRQGYTLLDCRLYLPSEWVNDEAYANKRQRCGVPKDIKFTTKPNLALEMLKALRQSGQLKGQWVTCVVRISGMRWPIETCFEDSKQLLGMGDYEVRSFCGWHHHMTLVMLAHHFLVRLQCLVKKKSLH